MSLGDSLITRAARGFTPAERAYLGRVAANPAFAALRTLAHARGLDLLGATYVLPFPDSAWWFDVRIPLSPFMRVQEAASANVARAAWLVSQGRQAEAETAIRETISVGLLLMDEGTEVIEGIIGTSITAKGRSALVSFYDATGRPVEARALRAAYDSVVNRNVTLDSARAEAAVVLDVPALRRQLIGDVRNPSLSREQRWNLAHITMYVQCTNMRELMFGPDDDLRAMLEVARRELVRYPSEAAVFRMLEATPGGVPRRL